MKNKFMLLTQKIPERFQKSRWTYRTTIEKVRVMSVAEGYAMVRFTGCAPFVTSTKNLSEITVDSDAGSQAESTHGGNLGRIL